MSNKSMSKMDMRSAIVAFSVVAMLVFSFGVSNVDAAVSEVVISSDISTADVMVGDFVIATLTLDNKDADFAKQEVYLAYSFVGGVNWEVKLKNTNGNLLEDQTISVGDQDQTTVTVEIYCNGVCEAGDTNVLTIFGKTDPRWYSGGSDDTETCGSSDCLTDTTPPSSSSNNTNSVTITLTARTGGAHTVDCDDVSGDGDNKLFHGEEYQWGFDLENTGFNSDTYTFETSVTTASGGTVDGWTVDTGLSNKVLTGTSDTTSSAVHSTEGSMTIKLADSTRPGSYLVGMQVTGTNSGNVEGCQFDVIVPEPDLEVLVTDIFFSHSSAWINSRGDSQRVEISATVRNNGGTVDSEGTIVTGVKVIFLVDGSQFGSEITLDDTNGNGVLGYQEEEVASVQWNPGRAHDSNEVGIPIKVSVDPSVDIQESDADNNIASTHFKVVKTKASNPSFYMSFLSLVGAVGAAVLMSSYYRNKDSEE